MKIQKINPKQSINWWVLAALTATITISSCKKEIKDKSGENQITFSASDAVAGTQQLGLPYQEGNIVLGQHLQNPYTLATMNTAYANVVQRGVSSIYPLYATLL